MNKTLLIIICDFLLISILALVEFKPSVEEQLVDEEGLRDEAAEEMLELLQLSLEHESSQRKEFEESLDVTLSELNQTQESLQEVSNDLDKTRSERAALAGSLETTRNSLALTREEKAALQISLVENEERSRRLQEELKLQQELAGEKAAALASAEETLSQLKSEQQQMATELQILDTEKQMLAQNLITAEAEVERARIDAERARVRSESLAAGVSELAASSTALKEEIRENQPLSLNTIYSRFEENRIFLTFQWKEPGLFGAVNREAILQTLMLDTGSGVFAVFATTNTPLGRSSKSGVSATMQIGGRSFRVTEIGFLSGEDRIGAIQIPVSVGEASGRRIFKPEIDPLKFSSAVLVTDDRQLYGEIPIRVPPGEKGYLEVQSKLFTRLFGEFSPTAGDYVFSMTGQLTGIMVSEDRARIIENPLFGDFKKLTVTP